MTWMDDADLLLENWSVRGAKRYSGLLYINGKCTNEWKETNKHSELNPDKAPHLSALPAPPLPLLPHLLLRLHCSTTLHNLYSQQSIETASGKTYRLGKPSEEFAPLVEAWFKKELGA